jgi:hypothetical protein
MNDDERAERRAAIKAISRRTPKELEAIREATRFARKNYVVPKASLCQTHDCKTIVYGGSFCTMCSSPAPEIEPVKVAMFQVSAAPKIVELPVNKPQKAIGPVGIAVVCLMIVFSLVAAYAQKNSESRATQALVAD